MNVLYLLFKSHRGKRTLSFLNTQKGPTNRAMNLTHEFEKQYKKGLSRLSCQVELTKEHDGLIVHLLDEDIR